VKTPMPLRSARADSGFSLPEVLISMFIMMVVLAGTFAAMTNAMKAEEQVRGITTLNGYLRSSMDLVVRDLLQVGQGLPTGRVIGVPNGAGAVAIVRPGPVAAGGCGGAVTFPVAPRLSAVTVGPNLGPAIPRGVGAPVIPDDCSDVITTLAHDGAFENVNVSSMAANAQSITIYPYGPDGIVGSPDDIDISDDPDARGDNLRVGDLLEIAKGSTSTLAYVTDVTGQTVTFAPNDPLQLNQFDAGLVMLGTLNRSRVTAPADPTAPVLVGAVEQPGPSVASRVRMITYYVDTTTTPTSPRLVRRIGAGTPNAVAFELEAFRITYDIADGTDNPAGARMDATDLTTGRDCNGVVCSPNQIRKANVAMAIRSARKNASAGYQQNTLFTQVALRSLSFVDRF
jgi:hypothetical protein